MPINFPIFSGTPAGGAPDANYKGWVASESALNTQYPTGQAGWYAINGGTDTVWVWSPDTSTWVDTGAAGAPPTAGTYTNPLATPVTVGGIDAGSTFNNATMTEMWDDLLYPELNPSLTNPSSTFTMSPSGFQETGEVIATISFSAAFNRGTINPAYGTSGFRSGLPNTYQYTGTGLTDDASTTLTNSQTVTTYTVLSGAQSWTGSVAYDAGEQPKTNKGNDYDAELAAGSTSAITRTITGVYPAFATTVDNTTMTKQTLISMTSTYIQTDMVAEDATNKQVLDLPDAWSAITGIQFYNTVSSAWEWIGGSKLASLGTFTATTTTHTIQGNVINYDRFTHNGSQIGARQLRFYTT